MRLLSPHHHRPLPLRRQRRYCLEPPFGVGYAPEGMVAVDGNLLLPPPDGLFILLPCGPCLVRLDGDLLEYGALARSLFVQLLAVDQRPARGDGEEEEAHGGV